LANRRLPTFIEDLDSTLQFMVFTVDALPGHKFCSVTTTDKRGKGSRGRGGRERGGVKG